MGESDRPAGSVSEFLANLQVAQWSEEGMQTPCGDCSACCSSLDVIVEDDERSALQAIEPQFLRKFHSGGRTYWNLLKQPDGSCPKLIGGRCSIWSDRPRMCKRFDCRLFALSEIPSPSPALDERISSWKFTFDEEGDGEHFQAFRRAIQLIDGNEKTFARRGVEAGTIKSASLAVDLRYLFLTNEARSESELLSKALIEVRTLQLRLQHSIQPE